MKSKKGFTLIELVMVIVILGILAAVAIPKFVDLSTNAKEASRDSIKGVIASACSMYYANEAANKGTAAFPPDTTTVATLLEGETWPDNPVTGNPFGYNATSGRAEDA